MREAWSPAWLAAQAGLLAFGLLIAALTGAAGAEQPALGPLLRSLDFRAYPLRTMPPPFGGSTLDARHLSLAEHRGRVIVLNSWASWCLECRPEMFVVGRDGGTIALAIGPRQWESPQARALIEALLAEFAPGTVTQ